MDFNFKKLASDASSAFTRAVQFTEEKLGKAERTELDAHFENLLLRADKTEEHTKKLLACLEAYLQPNPTLRMEEFMYEQLQLKKETRMNNLEYLGQAMQEAAAEFGPSTPYGEALYTVAQTQYKIGAAERELVQSSLSASLTPIKRFLEGDMRTIAKERKVLNAKRLDLDACKSRLRKAKSLENQANAEADLRVAQSEFDKQAEILKLLLEGIQTAHNNHLKALRDFVECQMAFYAQAHQHMADLQRTLSGDLDSSVPFSGLLIERQSTEEPTTPAKSLGLEDGATRKAKALFDYDASGPEELELSRNEEYLIYRLPGLDTDYVMAESGDRRGVVPLAYLSLLP